MIKLSINEVKEAIVDFIKKKAFQDINVGDVTFSTQCGFENVPLNITGYAARMMVRAQPSSPTTVLDLSTDNSKITIVGSTGTVTINVTASEMNGISARSYRYDLELVNGDTVIPLLEGAFIVKPQVTR